MNFTGLLRILHQSFCCWPSGQGRYVSLSAETTSAAIGITNDCFRDDQKSVVINPSPKNTIKIKAAPDNTETDKIRVFIVQVSCVYV